MPELKVAAWNAQDAFGDDERQAAALETVKQLDADVLYIGEFDPGGHPISSEIDEHQRNFAALGYRLCLSDYYRAGQLYNHPLHHMAIADRTGGQTSEFTAGNRWAYHLSTNGSDIIGIHHEDYREADRLEAAQQTTLLLDGLMADDERPQIVMGGFNAMDPDDEAATPLRLLRPTSEALRRRLGDDFDYYIRPQGLAGRRNRLASLAVRLIDMSSGSTVEWYRQQGFTQSDPLHRPTIGFGRGSKPRYKIDHILGRNVEFSEYQTMRTKVSDHIAIAALANY